MRLDIYLDYRGTCEEAFTSYAEHFGGTVVNVTHHG